MRYPLLHIYNFLRLSLVDVHAIQRIVQSISVDRQFILDITVIFGEVHTILVIRKQFKQFSYNLSRAKDHSEKHIKPI